MAQWFIKRWQAFRWMFIYKVISTGVQLYLASLIATNGSSQDPFLALITIAHFGAIVAALRGIDALIDPVFNHSKPPELKDTPPTPVIPPTV